MYSRHICKYVQGSLQGWPGCCVREGASHPHGEPRKGQRHGSCSRDSFPPQWSHDVPFNARLLLQWQRRLMLMPKQPEYTASARSAFAMRRLSGVPLGRSRPSRQRHRVKVRGCRRARQCPRQPSRWRQQSPGRAAAQRGSADASQKGHASGAWLATEAWSAPTRVRSRSTSSRKPPISRSRTCSWLVSSASRCCSASFVVPAAQVVQDTGTDVANFCSHSGWFAGCALLSGVASRTDLDENH